MKQKGMTKQEALVVLAILLVIGTVSFFNFQKSEVLGHDIQRKNDLKHIRAMLDDYRKAIQSYPASKDEKILACGEEENLSVCEWGRDTLNKVGTLPEDPLAPPKHYKYLYLSDTRNFQLFAHLEQMSDDEYNEGVVKRNLDCGGVVCNFGISSGVSLDKDVSEVE